MTAVFDKSSKIQLLSQAALITIFTFILIAFVIPGINANSVEIKVNSEGIEDIRLNIAEINIEELDKKLDAIDRKLNKIVLGMCGEFGGKYCE